MLNLTDSITARDSEIRQLEQEHASISAKSRALQLELAQDPGFQSFWDQIARNDRDVKSLEHKIRHHEGERRSFDDQLRPKEAEQKSLQRKIKDVDDELRIVDVKEAECATAYTHAERAAKQRAQERARMQEQVQIDRPLGFPGLDEPTPGPSQSSHHGGHGDKHSHHDREYQEEVAKIRTPQSFDLEKKEIQRKRDGLRAQLHSVESVMDGLQKRVNAEDKTIKQLERDISKLNDDTKKVRDEITKKEHYLQNLRDQLSKSELACLRVEQKIGQTRAEAQRLRDRRDFASREIQGIVGQMAYF